MQSSIAPGGRPRVTVVTPCYNDAGTIGRAIASALQQDGGNVSVIVVDDGGEARPSRAELGDRRITVLTNQRNLGAPASRNRGLDLVTTPFVSFLDADDRFDGDFLAPLIRAMEVADADIGFGPSVTWNPQRGYGARRLARYRDHADAFSQWLGKRNNVNCASVLWSTRFVRAIGGWDCDISRNQDGEIALRAILKGANFVTSDQGAGVWTNDRTLPRITTRNDNFGSLLQIVDKFLALRSAVVPDDTRVRVCARYCLTIAHLAFASGQDEIGRQALHRRRALGFSDYDADWRYVLSASLRVVPRMPRIMLWRLVRKVTGSLA